MTDKILYTDVVAGPASYLTGGFVVTTTLASVEACGLNISAPGANLGQVDFECDLNSPLAGQVTMRLLRKTYSKLTSDTVLIGLGSGVTAPVASGRNYTVLSHSHAIDHDHAAVTSSAPGSSGAGAILGVGGINLTTHTHSFDPANFVGTSGSEAAHNHTWENIYEHQHSITNTATNLFVTELPNGTDISGATINLLAVGT